MVYPALRPVLVSGLALLGLVAGPMRPVFAESPDAEAIVMALGGEATRSIKTCERQAKRDPADLPEGRAYAVDLVIEFEFNSDVVKPGGAADALGKALQNPRLACHDFLLAGHTDGVGKEAYNMTLSERRAVSLRRYLTQKFGVDASHLDARGYGQSHLRNPQDPKAAENRRVEIVNLTAADK